MDLKGWQRGESSHQNVCVNVLLRWFFRRKLKLDVTSMECMAFFCVKSLGMNEKKIG